MPLKTPPGGISGIKESKLAIEALAPLDAIPTRREKAEAAQLVKHGKIYEPSCPVCTHPERALIEDRFQSWTPYADLATITGLDKDALMLHFRSLGMQEKRSHNTDALMAVIIEAKMNKLDADDISVADMIKLIQHRDKLNKRIEAPAKGNMPTVIVINAPMKGAGLKGPSTGGIIPGKLARPVLGPGGPKAEPEGEKK